MPLTISPISETQSKFGWVFSFSVLALLLLASYSIIDESSTGSLLASLFIVAIPVKVGYRKRLCLFVVGISNGLLGPLAGMITVPLTLCLIGMCHQALITLLLFGSIALLVPYLQNIPNDLIVRIQLVSLLYIVIPAWCVALVLRKAIVRSGAYVLWVSPMLVVALVALASQYWIKPDDFTSPQFRIAAILVPAFLFALAGCRISLKPQSFATLPVAILFVIGAIVGFALPAVPINTVLFDESHGKWETVKGAFGPNDFGRSANYTYSKLYEKAGKLHSTVSVLEKETDELPLASNSLIVLKMPSEPFSREFISRVGGWVRDGGRLLIVADHTDLYDTTQNLNELLGNEFGLLVKSDAVSDRLGMPNMPRMNHGGIFLGRIDANSITFPWQTGSSLLKYPLGGVQLSTYGLGFSEEANYSRANRFGTFEPDFSNRYLAHTSVVAKAVGLGGVVLLMDSTPWSNFSIFKAQYLQLYRGIFGALEHMSQIRIVGLSGFVFLLFGLMLSFRATKTVTLLSSLCFGMALSSAVVLGIESFSKPLKGKDFYVEAVLGNSAKTEILKQLVNPGEANYSRMLSSLGKYGLDVMALPQGTLVRNLEESDKWLFLEPTEKQLPQRDELLDKIRSGGNVVILFSPEQAADPSIRFWLQGLGLRTSKKTGLSLSDFQKNDRGSLIGGRGAALGRSVFVVTEPNSTSMLKIYEADSYIQSYTIRPSTIPRTTGLLSIGFSSSQFSDDVIGDVWEGTQYSSLGKLREMQIAAILSDEERPELMPRWMHRVDAPSFNKLPQFVVTENGKTVLSGDLPIVSGADGTVEYFINLRAQAAEFVRLYCPKGSYQTFCADRLLANDMIEWVVTWKGKSTQSIDAIELIHERGMSGLGSTWNVVFGK